MSKFKVGDKCVLVKKGVNYNNKLGVVVEIVESYGDYYITSLGNLVVREDRLELVSKYDTVKEKTVTVFVDCQGEEHATKELAQKSNRHAEFLAYLHQSKIYSSPANFILNCQDHREAVLKFLT